MTVRRLMSEMDSRELTYWMAYASVSPIGDERLDLAAAQICQTLGNRTGGRDGSPFQITDYLHDLWGDMPVVVLDEYPTPEELLTKAKMICGWVGEINQAKAIMRGENAGR